MRKNIFKVFSSPPNKEVLVETLGRQWLRALWMEAPLLGICIRVQGPPGEAESWTATPCRDCKALAVLHVWCGESSCPLESCLPGKAFVIVYSGAWKITHRFSARRQTLHKHKLIQARPLSIKDFSEKMEEFSFGHILPHFLSQSA